MSIVHHSFCSLYEIWVTEISFRHYWDRLLPYQHYECQMLARIANFAVIMGHNCETRPQFSQIHYFYCRGWELVMEECRWRGAVYTAICDL